MTPSTQYIFNAGKFAARVEDYNRDVQRLLHEMGISQKATQKEVRGDGGDSLRSMSGDVCPIVRASVEAPPDNNG